MDKTIIFRRPFSLNSAVIKEPNKRTNNNDAPTGLDKVFIICGTTKKISIKIVINDKEIGAKYFFNKHHSSLKFIMKVHWI